MQTGLESKGFLDNALMLTKTWEVFRSQGKLPGHLQRTAEVLLSKTPNHHVLI